MPIQNLARIWVWEFIQNLPLAAAFTTAVRFAARGDAALAWLTALTGSATGSLLIRITEPSIAPGEPETRLETAANFTLFSLAIGLFSQYFGSQAGGWPADAALGLLTGILASALQSRAARSPLSPSHTTALGGAFAAALASFRLWGTRIAPFPAAAVIAVLATSIIVWVEYRPAS